ncbi:MULTISPECIES: hypothetical protein [Bacteroides]|nr:MULTISPECIES: hypothetical protein [unclassified Bacteroides]
MKYRELGNSRLRVSAIFNHKKASRRQFQILLSFLHPRGGQ